MISCNLETDKLKHAGKKISEIVPLSFVCQETP